jgi:hypothetical protein
MDIKKVLSWGFNTLWGKASLLRQGKHRPQAPLADRILADALRLVEIPSPTHHEELRAAFVLERLGALGLNAQVDEQGNLLVRIRPRNTNDGPPFLLFTCLGSSRWHSLESLSSVDASIAAGAGLADVLGAASLLSLAEGIESSRISVERDILLFFIARSLDDPEGDIFKVFSESPADRPCAALGLRGFSLDQIVSADEGAYRICIQVEQEEAAPDNGPLQSQIVDTVIAIAKNLSGITWDSEQTTHCRIRRVETGDGFGRFPTEGLIELELESSDSQFLEMAMKTVTATAENSVQIQGVKVSVRIVSFVPVGGRELNAGFLKLVLNHCKDQHIKISQYSGSDTSAYFSALGIPAISIGAARGRMGLRRDRVEISSIEQGRFLVEALVQAVGGGVLE